jgi:hypothetical protein
MEWASVHGQGGGEAVCFGEPAPVLALTKLKHELWLS